MRPNLTNSGRHPNGISLLEVLIAVLLGGLALFAANYLLRTAVRGGEHLQEQEDLLHTRRVVRDGLSCLSTLKALGPPFPVHCERGPFAIRDERERVLGQAELGAWKIGSWHVRGSCFREGLVAKVLVERARLTSNTTFAAHPVSRQPEDWKPLFEKGISFCAYTESP